MIKIPVQRKVLFEKYNIKHEIEEFLLLSLEGCEIRLLKNYPESIFYIKNDIWLFWQDYQNGYLWIKFDKIWSVLESKYELSYEQIQDFITNTLDEPLKQHELTPRLTTIKRWSFLDEPLKQHELTPLPSKLINWNVLDEPLKQHELTPHPRKSAKKIVLG